MVRWSLTWFSKSSAQMFSTHVAKVGSVSSLQRILNISKCENDLMLLPCDAYLLTESGVDLLLQRREQGGVIWQHNRMQSVFATIPQRWSAPVNTTSLTEYLASMPRIHVHDHDSNFFHFNSTEEIELHVQKIRLLQEKFHHSQSHR